MAKRRLCYLSIGEKSDICTQVEKSKREEGRACLTNMQSINGKGAVGHDCLTRTERQWGKVHSCLGSTKPEGGVFIWRRYGYNKYSTRQKL